MRVVFAGTPEFAAVALDALLAAGFTVPLVLTQPDRPAGRGMKLQASAVKQRAVAAGIPVAQPQGLRLDGKFAADAAADLDPRLGSVRTQTARKRDRLHQRRPLADHIGAGPGDFPVRCLAHLDLARGRESGREQRGERGGDVLNDEDRYRQRACELGEQVHQGHRTAGGDADAERPGKAYAARRSRLWRGVGR